jgi:hypothetical protein
VENICIRKTDGDGEDTQKEGMQKNGLPKLTLYYKLSGKRKYKKSKKNTKSWMKVDGTGSISFKCSYPKMNNNSVYRDIRGCIQTFPD